AEQVTEPLVEAQQAAIGRLMGDADDRPVERRPKEPLARVRVCFLGPPALHLGVLVVWPGPLLHPLSGPSAPSCAFALVGHAVLSPCPTRRTGLYKAAHRRVPTDTVCHFQD